jgi:hypothetical protein
VRETHDINISGHYSQQEADANKVAVEAISKSITKKSPAQALLQLQGTQGAMLN